MKVRKQKLKPIKGYERDIVELLPVKLLMLVGDTLW
jgi:hypothetical protein